MTSKIKFSDYDIGKIVCVGRNYVAHAKELNNPIPQTPLLFIKPSSCLVDLAQPLRIPNNQGAVHFELELAVLIGESLDNPSAEQAFSAIAGLGLALDLTLRELQDKLKQKGHPWERAKAFKGACPISEFVRPSQLQIKNSDDLQNLEFKLMLNNQLQQLGQTQKMLFSIIDLIQNASQAFSLQKGDLLLTGTPEGVGVLHPDDKLECSLSDVLCINTCIN